MCTEQCERAFHVLKVHLTSDTVVRIPDVTKKFVLRTDACDTGVDAVLLQEHDELLCPVAYASCKLSKAERNYIVTERECLALVFGITRFERYLFGQTFIVELDHSPLIFLGQSKGVKDD